MSIPISLQPDEEVGCVQVRPHGDDLPAVFNTRSRVLRSGGQTRVEITSAASVDEPAIGLVVSVGCASPVARDYVLFLDPPTLTSTPAVEAAAPVAAPARRTPRNRPARAESAQESAAAAAASVDRPARTPRPARRRTPTVRPDDTANPPTKAPVPSRVRPPASGGDRLSVVPTEPPVIGRTSRSPQPGVFPPPVANGAPAVAAARAAASATAGAASAPVAGSTTPVESAATAAGGAPAAAAPVSPTAATPPPLPDVDALAREEALRQQQAALQSQIKNLSDQISALRVQATSLAARNQALEGTVFSPLLVWLLIALAVLAIAVAGWMSWRYTQLRRSLEGSAWWTSQTVQDGDEGSAPVAAAPATGQAAGGTIRPTPRAPSRPQTVAPVPSEVRASVQAPTASSAQVSNIDRIRPAVRAPGSGYTAAMDTDFTVSDIEAAMATVRTVSPVRGDKAHNPLEDSDFSGLGGPTITSPFDEVPPAPASATTDDESAQFVDLDIPPIQPLASGPSAVPPKPAASMPSPFDTPLDFSTRTSAPTPTPVTAADLAFEFPGFDPLGTDSMKTTIIDRSAPDAEPTDEGASTAPEGLDFELPSQTQILAMTPFDPAASTGGAVRHGATALNDLFAKADGPASDTILDLDGTPLSMTEVDRLTSPLGPLAEFEGVSGRTRLARFADLLTRVDDQSIADPLGAIAELRLHVLRDERIPTLLWLRLFELYKVVGKRPVHDALAEHFARRYHRPMVGWTQTLADRTPQRPLSALVAIDRQIEQQWGTEAGIAYLETLLCDRTQEDAIVFNAVLQADLLDAAKVFPEPNGTPGDG